MAQERLHIPLLAAVAALAGIVGILPLFGSTAYATGLDLDGVVSVTEFSFPGAPASKTTNAPQAAPFLLSLADNADELFPDHGELLLDMSELVVYDNRTPLPGACTGRTNTQVCVIQRAKVGSAKQHPVGTQAKLATQLTAPLTGTPARTTLAMNIDKEESDPGNEPADPPFAISVGSDTGFGTDGFLTISHQDTDAFGATTEFFQYDRSCGSPTQLCIIARALQSNKLRSAHLADGYPQPGGTPGRSLVDKHEQIQVKSSAGFFPAGNLLVYTIDTQEDPLGGDAELLGYANVQNIKTPEATQFHVTSRGASTATFKTTPISPHSADSIVTGADQFVVARQRYESPIPGLTSTEDCNATCVANSVGTFQVAYTQYQPNGPPKALDPKQLNVPIIGQEVILLNALNQPFLSTGGFNHLIFGPVPLVDTDGTKDGTLNLISPCITNFTPGTNLLVIASIELDNDYASPDTGEVIAVMDTVTGPGGGNDGNASTHDDCDDPAGTGETTLTTYIYPNDPDISDDDTDGDGCTDDQELDNFVGSGQRDPWNPGDFFDADASGAVTIDDIFDVAGFFGLTSGTGTYDQDILPGGGNGKVDGEERDRGPSYGPFSHNLATANGSITIDDIFAVAVQFGHAC